MDPSTGQHQQMCSNNQSLENMLASCSSINKSQQQQQQQQQDQLKKPRPQPEQALKCPRCDSTNTKFCYYNNYSLSQPRYFCKSCRRYWTKGGTLRNVPVGGGCRKNKKPSSSSSSSKIRIHDHHHQPFTTHHHANHNPLTIPHFPYDHSNNDLTTLALTTLQKGQQLGSFDDEHDFSILGHPTSEILTNVSAMNTNPGFFDALRSGFLGNNMQNNVYYGSYGNNNNSSGNNNGDISSGGGDMMMMMPYDDTIHDEMSVATTQAVSVTTMKQEVCNGREQSENNRVLWGFPWQLNGDTNVNEIDSGRGNSWNNGFASSWHGLLNSPLM